MLNLARLEAYYWIARLGSFRAASVRLGLTQPSISLRIKELEQEVGCPLFERVGRNVRLTDRGVTMLEYVERVLTLVHELEGHIGNRVPLRGVLRLGVPDSFAILCLATLLKAIAHDHPDLNVAVSVDNSRALAQKLEEGSLDVAVLAEPQSTKHMRAEHLGFQSLLWIASAQLDLPDRPLHAKDLARFQLFTNPAPSNTFSVLMDWFLEAGLSPPRLSTCNSVAIIIGLVRNAAGISLLPRCIAEEHLESGLLRELDISPVLPKQEMFIAASKAATSRAAPEIFRFIRTAVQGSGFVDASPVR